MAKYKRKSSRQGWTEAQMEEALKAVNSKVMGAKKASKAFGVPRSTLRRRRDGGNKFAKGAAKGLGSFKVGIVLKGIIVPVTGSREI